MAIPVVGAVVVGFLILGFFLYLITIYNGLILLKVNIPKAWANIDVLLKQRHDEVPNLLATVKGIKDFEQSVMEQVTRARSQSMAAQSLGEKAASDQALGGALNRLFAVAENYPQLKAQENFLLLQKRLSELESEIADRRSFYNDSTAAFNSRIAEFPDVLVARFLNLQPFPLFQVEEAEKAPVQVELSKA